MSDVLYIVMPAYNEEANIEKTIRNWYPIIDKYNGEGKSRLLIFNDGSKDNTFAVGTKLMAEYPLFEMVDKPNSGHGPTLIMAYNYAIEHGADWVFQTDSDGQTNPDEFHAFWDIKDDNDAIIGVRRQRGDGKQRAFVEKVVCILVKMFFKVKVEDANAPFRLMRANVLKNLVDKLPIDFNIPNIMLTTYFVHYGKRVVFRDITFKPRQAGKNSINIKRIVKIGMKALKDFRILKKEM